jgi:Glycine zipper
MQKKSFRGMTTAGLAVALLITAAGCNNLPGTRGQQGAAIGGLGGAATGALVGGEHHRLLGALLGGAVGAGGGYLIGANSDRITGRDQTGAQEAVRRAQEHPATPQQAMSAPTADLNGDGFVTMDEVVAMRQAGFPDQQILDKMRATGQVFELSPDQQNYLRTNGVDQYVIDQIPQLNREARDRLLSGAGYPSGQAPTSPPPAYPPSSSYPAPGATSPYYPQAPGPNTPVPPPPQ